MLAFLFALAGVSSSLIGLGGGTSYLIFMELFKLPIHIIPIIALTSNIIVSGIGATVRLSKKEKISPTLLITILAPSMTFAYIGASFRFQEQFYRLLLNLLVLLVILCRLILQYRMDQKKAAEWPEKAAQRQEDCLYPKIAPLLLACISGAVGLISGLIGIGGGIILGPILYLFGMSYRYIPIITAIYIFLNSIVGIAAKLQFSVGPLFVELQDYIILPIISVFSSIFTMYFITYRINSNHIKIIVMATISFMALYNIIRLFYE